jgi:isoleucyl-tRNA synthetase
MEDVIEGKDYSFPAAEEAILQLWDRLDAFKEQLRRTEGQPEYVFFDGPPFATGLPHYGHILAGTLKVGPHQPPHSCMEAHAHPARRWCPKGAASMVLDTTRPAMPTHATITCAFQDIVTRYASTTGHHVIRRFGWDCHGLPVEYEIDKKLGGRQGWMLLHGLKQSGDQSTWHGLAGHPRGWRDCMRHLGHAGGAAMPCVPAPLLLVLQA